MGGEETFVRGRVGRPIFRRRRLKFAAAISLLAAGLTFGVAPVIGDGLNQQPLPASPLTPPTVVSTVAQTSASGATTSAGPSKKGTRRIVLRSRITEVPVVTEEGKGTFVGVKCPKSYKALSGGVISGYINLLISSSSPNNPLSGKYTPRTWWLTVTNANIDGQGGSLSWRGVVNCIAPVSVRK
jgi:hypothetical protein